MAQKHQEKSLTNGMVKCPQCKKIVTKTSFYMHKIAHKYESMKKCQKCSHCEMVFLTKQGFNLNSLRKHKNEKTSAEKIKVDSKMREKVKCLECFAVVKRSFYKKHKLRHEDEKLGIKYECNQCCNCYATKSGLTVHVKKHHKK